MNENDVLADPDASEWLRNALSAALKCDAVHVANEAGRLARVLQQRAVRLAQLEAIVLDSQGDAATVGGFSKLRSA